MKKLLKVALIAVCIVFAGNLAKAQSKIGYVAVDAIVDQMPETKVAIKTITDYNQHPLLGIQLAIH